MDNLHLNFIKKWSRQTRPLQNVTLAYDALHRINSRQEAILDAGALLGNKTKQYKYDGINLSQTIDALGNSTNYIYDNLGRLTEMQDALGDRLINIYDGNNNIITETSHEINFVTGETETFTKQIAYDVLNRPITLTDDLGHTKQFRYDSRNNLVSTSDSKDTPGLDAGPNAGTGNVTRYQYDGLGRLTAQIQKITDNGAGSGSEIASIITAYAWDDNSRLKSVTDARNNTTEFSYDALNRRIKTELADGSVYRKSFDRNSNVVESTDPSGFAVESVYDDGNRLTRKNILQNDNPINYETFGYDGLGRKTSAKTYNWPDALTNTVERAYNSLGNILRDSQNGLAVVNEYDLTGRRSRLIYPSGKTINYGRDAIGRIETINDTVLGNLAELAWSNLGQVGTRHYLNDVVTETNHDALKRVVRHISELTGGNIIAGFESGYDKANNRLYDSFLHSDGSGNVYSYDSISRLSGATYSIPSPESHIADPLSVSFSYHETFSYDSVHNWLSRLEHLGSLDPAQTIQTDYSADDVNAYNGAVSTQEGETVADKAYVYDANGNLLQDDKYVYTYDYRNYLTEVRDASTSALVAAYGYDALGRRISKTVSGVATTFIYDGLNVIEERAGVSVTSYTRGVNIDELVSVEKDGEVYFYHTDVSGNVVALTNSSSSVVERYTYTSFGKAQITDSEGNPIEQSEIGNPYLYTGRRYDSETGLYYYRARTYNPNLGRFLQQDPLGFIDSLNQYAYVLNNPVNFIDPFGLSRIVTWGFPDAGNPAIDTSDLDNPLNSSFIDYVDRGLNLNPEVSWGEMNGQPTLTIDYSNSSSGIINTISSFILKPFADFVRGAEQQSVAYYLYDQGDIANAASFDYASQSNLASSVPGITTTLAGAAEIYGITSTWARTLSYERNIMGSINSMREGNWFGRMTGHYYPTKLNYGGLPQPQNFNGRFMSYSANPGLTNSPFVNFGTGLSEGYMSGISGMTAPPTFGRAHYWGQTIGNIVGNVVGAFK